jgi:hypothetical protein
MMMHSNFEIAALTHEARIVAASRRHDVRSEHRQWRRRRRRRELQACDLGWTGLDLTVE